MDTSHYKLTWWKEAISLSTGPANHFSHFLQSQLLHQHKHWSDLIGEPINHIKKIINTAYQYVIQHYCNSWVSNNCSVKKKKERQFLMHTHLQNISNTNTHTHTNWFFISSSIIPSTEHKLELVLTGLIKKCLIGVRQQTFIFKCLLKSLSGLIKAHKAVMAICQSCQSQWQGWMGLIWWLRELECMFEKDNGECWSRNSEIEEDTVVINVILSLKERKRKGKK